MIRTTRRLTDVDRRALKMQEVLTAWYFSPTKANAFDLYEAVRIYFRLAPELKEG